MSSSFSLEFDNKKIVKNLSICFMIVFFLEFLVFNFPFWDSLFFDKTVNGVLVEYDLSQNEELEGGAIISHIDGKVSNVYLDLFKPDALPGEKIRIQLGITDSGNTIDYPLQETEIIKGIDESYYLRLHTVGNSSQISIRVISSDSGFIFDSNKVDLNKTRPFKVHLLRFVLLLFIGMAITIFYPGSPIYKVNLNLKDNMQRGFVLFLVLLQMFAFMEIGLISRKSDEVYTNPVRDNQYGYAAQALANGYLNIYQFEVPQELMDMDNPYDAQIRSRLLSTSTNDYSTLDEFSFYNGNLYFSYGLIPTILFFYPYYKMTNNFLPTSIAVIIPSILLVIAVFKFVYSLIKKYFNQTSFGIYIICSNVLLLSSGVLYWLSVPTTSVVSMSLAVLLTILAFDFWLNSVSGDGNIIPMKILIGSLCMALVFGCEPLMLIGGLALFQFFSKEIKNKKFFSSKSVFNTLCLIMPFVFIGMIVMLFNNMRFGNVFCFGEEYRLTTYDATHIGFVPSRYIFGIFAYLFQPINSLLSFPFINTVNIDIYNFQGFINSEPMMGGLFIINLIAFASFLMINKEIRLLSAKNDSLRLFYGLVVYGVLILLVVIQTKGLGLQYVSLFGLYFIIPALIASLNVLNVDKYKTKSILTVFVVLSVLCLISNYWILLADGKYNALYQNRPFIYYNLKYLFFSMR